MNVGPPLGADSTGENLTFMVIREPNDVRVVPQIAWGNGGALELPLEPLADLVVGPRHRTLTTLLPVGARGDLVVSVHHVLSGDCARLHDVQGAFAVGPCRRSHRLKDEGAD